MISNEPKLKSMKLFHLLLIISFASVVTTAVLSTTFLSKESIMDIITFSLYQSGNEIAPTDSLFIARVARQQIWNIHFYMGVLLPILGLIVYFLFTNINKKSIFKLNTMTASLLATFLMFVTGLSLYFRKELGFDSVLIENLRDTHWIGIYALIVVVPLHMYQTLYKKEYSHV